MKYVVDVSNACTREWEDSIPAGCGQLTFTPIKAHKNLFVVENASYEDLLMLSLAGIIPVPEIATEPPEETDYPSSCDYLVHTATGYIIMRMYFGKLSL